MDGRVAIKLVGNREVTIAAHVFGDWAAHPGIDHDDEPRLDWWVVTHVPNGRRIRCAGRMTEREALALAAALDQRKVTLPVYSGPDEVADVAGDPALSGRIRAVKTVVFDTLGRCAEG